MLCLATLSARGFYVRGEVAISERRSRDRGAGYTKKKPSTIQDSVWLAAPETKQCASWIEAAGIVEVVITIL